MNETFKVVPFVAAIDHKKGTTNDVAAQLQNIIKTHVDQGYQYVSVENITTWTNPDNGCFGLGAKPGHTSFNQMVIFKK
jgi:hypothetical protein